MPTLVAFCGWLSRTELSHVIQFAGWIIPSVQTVHILSVAVTFSSAVLVGLRSWDVTLRDQAPDMVARRFMPWIWPTLLVLAGTGTILIIAEPRRTLVNATFYLKMTLLLLAILVTLLQNRRLLALHGRTIIAADRLQLRGLAALSILLWSGIIFAGRWIAYMAPAE
jgi:uncharacterized membrane protein SirB2